MKEDILMSMKELAKTYQKIKNGNATEMEKHMFELELEMHSFERSYMIEKIEEYLNKSDSSIFQD